jgi:hypothetical protein
MFWALITALVAGFAGAGIGLGLRALTRKRLPLGVIPVSAGIAMIVATVATEYGWYPNVLRTMSPDLVVISQREQQAWYQPWTFVRPWVRGFISYSPSETLETAEGSDIYVVQIRMQERWQPQIVRPNLVDCAGNRRAEIVPDTEFDETGEPTNAAWLDVPADDPILSAVCDGGAAAS